MERAGQQYDLATIKVQRVQQRLRESARTLKFDRYQLSVARVDLSDRAVALYMQQPTDFLDVIFSSGSFTSLVDDVKTIQELSANDSQIVDAVRTATDAVKQQHDQLLVERTAARTLEAEAKARKESVAAGVARRQHILQSAKAEVATIEREQAAAAAAAARAAEAASASRSSSSSDPGAAYSGGSYPGLKLPGHPEVIAIARRYLGVPYVYGGASPSTGFDCSGLVMYCYAQIGIHLLHYSGDQQNEGLPVPMNDLIPGDLVFMGYPVSYHVALYAGNGQVIQAPYTGQVVSYGSLAGFQYAVRIP